MCQTFGGGRAKLYSYIFYFILRSNVHMLITEGKPYFGVSGN